MAPIAPGCPTLTQEFGCTSFAGEWRVPTSVCATGWYHRGIDLAGAGCDGTPLLAPRAGRVEAVGGFVGAGGLGPHAILLTLDDGKFAIYGHCDRADVDPGQHVNAGQQVGVVGQLGFATGPHLHFEVCTQLGTVPDGVLDPRPYLEVIEGDGPSQEQPYWTQHVKYDWGGSFRVWQPSAMFAEPGGQRMQDVPKDWVLNFDAVAKTNDERLWLRVSPGTWWIPDQDVDTANATPDPG